MIGFEEADGDEYDKPEISILVDKLFLEADEKIKHNIEKIFHGRERIAYDTRNDYPDIIAEICHEVIRTYCQSLGDFSQLRWEDTPKDIVESDIDAVKSYLADPRWSVNITPTDNQSKIKQTKSMMFNTIIDSLINK